MRSEKLFQSFQNCRLNDGMSSAFSLAEAVDFIRGTLRVADYAWKTLFAAKAEVFVGDDAGQSKEVLNVGEDTRWVGGKSLAAYEVQLINAEL